MADVVNFPKRFTSYRVAFLPFPDSPIVHFSMQCPYDKLDEFLTTLFSMPPDDAFYYEVHGMLADGTVEVVRGDINAEQPRGRVTVKHTALVFPGSTTADNIAAASARYIAEQSSKLTAGVKRRNSLTVASATPAAPAATKTEESPSLLTDSEGKPRYVWDANKAQYVEKATGHTINHSQWAELRAAREAKATTNRQLAVLPAATVVAEELSKIVKDLNNPLSEFPVVLTKIITEEFK